MRTYQVWVDGAEQGSAHSLALALSIAYVKASDSPERTADVYQGSEFTARVDVPTETDRAIAAGLEG